MRRALLVLAALAVVGTWAGPAVAKRLFTGKDVRDRSLTGRDLRSNSVTGRVVAGLSGRDIQRDSLDGSDIAEETLDVRRSRTADRADSAARADSAGRADSADSAASVAGVRLRRVHFAGLPGTEAVVLDLGGLRLRARCLEGSNLALAATTAAGPAWIRSSGTRAGNPAALYLEDDDFRTGDEFAPLGGTADDVATRVLYTSPAGETVTVDLMAEQGVAASRGYGCLVAGTATHAAG